MGTWSGLIGSSLTMVALTGADFTHATALLHRKDLMRRSGDALHLAIVSERGLGLATLDRKFATAARTIGVLVEAILPAGYA